MPNFGSPFAPPPPPPGPPWYNSTPAENTQQTPTQAELLGPTGQMQQGGGATDPGTTGFEMRAGTPFTQGDMDQEAINAEMRRRALPGLKSGPIGMLGSRRMMGMADVAGRSNFNPTATGLNNALMQRKMMEQSGGVRPGIYNGPNAVQAARQHGPDLERIRADMARHQTGAAMGPQNAALSGYMMSK